MWLAGKQILAKEKKISSLLLKDLQRALRQRPRRRRRHRHGLPLLRRRHVRHPGVNFINF